MTSTVTQESQPMQTIGNKRVIPLDAELPTVKKFQVTGWFFFELLIYEFEKMN